MRLASWRSLALRRSAARMRKVVSRSLRVGKRVKSERGWSFAGTYSTVTSSPVLESLAVSLTMRGGDIGRRSCDGEKTECEPVSSFFRRHRKRTLSPKPHMRARTGCWTTSRE